MPDIKSAEPNVSMLKDYLQKRFAISDQDITYLKDATGEEIKKEITKVKKFAREISKSSE